MRWNRCFWGPICLRRVFWVVVSVYFLCSRLFFGMNPLANMVRFGLVENTHCHVDKQKKLHRKDSKKCKQHVEFAKERRYSRTGPSVVDCGHWARLHRHLMDSIDQFKCRSFVVHNIYNLLYFWHLWCNMYTSHLTWGSMGSISSIFQSLFRLQSCIFCYFFLRPPCPSWRSWRRRWCFLPGPCGETRRSFWFVCAHLKDPAACEGGLGEGRAYLKEETRNESFEGGDLRKTMKNLPKVTH